MSPAELANTLFSNCARSSAFNASKVISAKDAIKIAQISGLAPTLKEQNELKENLGEIDQDAFAEWLLKIQTKERSIPNLMHLFEFLADNSSGLLHTRVLKNVLCQVGDRISEEEFSFLMERFCDVEGINVDEGIDYKKLLE